MDGSNSSFHGFQVVAASNISPNVTTTTNGAIAMTTTNDTANLCTVREQDRFMPIANVIRIVRKVLPPHAKISDDAKETIQECVSEYISFITSEANDRCQREQRKTITAEDVLWAMSKLGFDNYVEPLTSFLQKYREVEGDHRGSIRGEPLALKRRAEVANLPLGVAGNGGDPLYGFPCNHNYNHNHNHNHHGVGVYNSGEHGYYFGMAASYGINGNGDHGNANGEGAATSIQHQTAAIDPYNNSNYK